MSYEDYEVESKIIRKENEILLSGFQTFLTKSGLKKKTIEGHLANVEFYINNYLLYDDCINAKDGVFAINSFFNWFFPKKAMWSSRASTKQNAASLKKFYKYLLDKGILDITDYVHLLELIKNEMSEWQSHYNEEFYW